MRTERKSETLFFLLMNQKGSEIKKPPGIGRFCVNEIFINGAV